MENEAINDFQIEIGKYPGMWDSLEAKAIFADKEGEPLLLGIYCTFSSGLIPQADVVFESTGLTMVKEVLPFLRLQELLEGLQNGRVTLAGRNVKVEGFAKFGMNTWGGGRQGWIDIPYPYVLLHSNGKAPGELVDEGAITKRLLAYAYRGIDVLCQEKLGFQVGGGYVTQIRMIAPIFLGANAAFVYDKLRVALRCWPSLKVSDLSLSFEVMVNLLGKREAKRGQIDLSDSSKFEEGVGFSLMKEVDVPEQTESATVWVFHATRTEPMYALRCSKPANLRSNLIWGACKTILLRPSGGQIEGAPEILRDSLGLNHQVKDAGRLEAAVHALLGCAGFVCIFTGREWGVQGIDTLAFQPTMSKLFVVSVTTGNNIGDKIRTMLGPLSNLKKELELTGMQVAPAIVAPIEADMVLASDQKDAEAHGIRLVLRPQLVELLDGVINTSQDKFAELTDSLFGYQANTSVF